MPQDTNALGQSLTEFFSEAAPVDTAALSDFFSDIEPGTRAKLTAQQAVAARAGQRAQDIASTIGAVEPYAQAATISNVPRGIAQIGATVGGLAADLFTADTSLENTRAALTQGPGKYPVKQGLEHLMAQPGAGIGPYAAYAILEGAETLPLLYGGGPIARAIKPGFQAASQLFKSPVTRGVVSELAPEATYGGLFAAESLGEHGNVGEALRAGAYGAGYGVINRLTGPVSAGIISRLGLFDNPAAQRIIETATDQAIQQAFTHVASTPEYAWILKEYGPERLKGVIAQNTVSQLFFTLPRALGHIVGAPSEFQTALNAERSRIESLLSDTELALPRDVRTKEGMTARRAEIISRETDEFGRPIPEPADEMTRMDVIEAAIRSGELPVGAGRTEYERRGDVLNAIQGEAIGNRAAVEQRFEEALSDLALPESVLEQARINRLARGARPTTEATSAVSIGKTTTVPVETPSTTSTEVVGEVRKPTETKVEEKPTPEKTGELDFSPESAKKRVAWTTRLHALGPDTDSDRWDAIENTYIWAEEGEKALPGVPHGDIFAVQVKEGAYPSSPVVDVIFVHRSKLNELFNDPKFKEAYPTGRFINNVQPGVKPYNPRKGEPNYAQWKEGKRPAAAPETPAKPEVEITDPVNIRIVGVVVEVPEIQLEAIARGKSNMHSGRMVPALLGYTGDAITVRGPHKQGRVAYKIPLVALEGQYNQTQEGVTVSKKAVIDYMNDPAKREFARVKGDTARNVYHWFPADIDTFQKERKPVGRPHKTVKSGVGLKEDLGGRARAPEKKKVDPIAHEAFQALMKDRYDLIEEFLAKNPEELGDDYWNKVEDALLTLRDAADNPIYDTREKAKAIVSVLKIVQELAKANQIDWQAFIGEVYDTGTPFGPVQMRHLESVLDRTGLSDEAKDSIRAVLNSPIGRYLDSRGILVRILGSTGGKVAGYYDRHDPIGRMINFVRAARDLDAYVHEWFHPLWEILQPSDRQLVAELRMADINRRLAQAKAGTTLYDQLAYLATHEVPNVESWQDLGFDNALYRLRSPEEYFAYMMTERFQKDRVGTKEILARQDSFIAKIKEIIAVILDYLKQRIPGLRTKADILQRRLLDGKYEVNVPLEAREPGAQGIIEGPLLDPDNPDNWEIRKDMAYDQLKPWLLIRPAGEGHFIPQSDWNAFFSPGGAISDAEGAHILGNFASAAEANEFRKSFYDQYQSALRLRDTPAAGHPDNPYNWSVRHEPGMDPTKPWWIYGFVDDQFRESFATEDQANAELAVRRRKFDEWRGQGTQGMVELRTDLEGNLRGDVVRALRFPANQRIDGQQLLGRLRNVMGGNEFKAYDFNGLSRFLSQPRTPEELRGWMVSNGPKVDTKVFRSGQTTRTSITPEQDRKLARFAEIQHWHDTLPTERRAELDEVFDPIFGYDDPATVLRSKNWDTAAIELATRYRDLERETRDYRNISGYDPDRHKRVTPQALPQTVVMARAPYQHEIPAREIMRRRQAGESMPSSREMGVLHTGTHFGSEDVNVLGWARIQYVERNGKKIAHIIELQSDWAQKRRDQGELIKKNRSTEAVASESANYIPDHPLLADWQRLTLKAAIDQAIKDRADAIVISDAETAMMTEGHDKTIRAGEYEYFPYGTPEVPAYKIATEIAEHLGRTFPGRGTVAIAKNPFDDRIRSAGNPEGIRIRVSGDPELIAEAKQLGFTEVRPAQEPGMRLNYDRLAPKILAELTGMRGERTDLGEHQKAVAIHDEDDLRLVGDPRRMDGTSVKYRSDLLFKNSDGTPKINVTGAYFDLGKVKQKTEPFTMFGSDKLRDALSEGTQGLPERPEEGTYVPHALMQWDRGVGYEANQYFDWLTLPKEQGGKGLSAAAAQEVINRFAAQKGVDPDITSLGLPTREQLPRDFPGIITRAEYEEWKRTGKMPPPPMIQELPPERGTQGLPDIPAEDREWLRGVKVTPEEVAASKTINEFFEILRQRNPEKRLRAGESGTGEHLFEVGPGGATHMSTLLALENARRIYFDIHDKLGTQGLPEPKSEEVLPFFDLIRKSDDELRELAKRGKFGPGVPASQAVRDVASGARLIGYVEGDEYGGISALRLARSLGLQTFTPPDWRSWSDVVFYYRPERQADALNRIDLFKRVYESRKLAPAWGYLNGALLDYKPEDIALFLVTHPNDPSFGLAQLQGARQTLQRLERRGTQGMLESPDAIKDMVWPMSETWAPVFYRRMASTLNRGMVPARQFTAYAQLSDGAKHALRDIVPGRVATQNIDAPTFREMLKDDSLTPQQKSAHVHHGFQEWLLFQRNKEDFINEQHGVDRKLEEAIKRGIEMAPKTNEADFLSHNLLGQILDKIKAERERTAKEGADNARLDEVINRFDQLKAHFKDPAAFSLAMRGIARLVGRKALIDAAPGEEALDLISNATGFPGLSGNQLTPQQWIKALAIHIDQLQAPNGAKRILAGQDAIESALYIIRQMSDAKSRILELQMAEDGTLKKFNQEYLQDLQAKIPKGFNAILAKYASAKVEADALTSALKRIDRLIDSLTIKKEDYRQAREYLDQLLADPEHIDFGKAVTEYAGATEAISTDEGTVIVYEHPLTKKPIRIDHGISVNRLETIAKMQQLAWDGLEYASRPDADPVKAASWRDFAETVDLHILNLSPGKDVLADPVSFPILDPIQTMLKNKIAIIAETSLSRIPGDIALRVTRAIESFATMKKAANEYQKDDGAKVLASNYRAWKSHPNIKTLGQWRDEVAGPMQDSRQYYGQAVYNVGDIIAGFGHVITKADKQAIDAQYRYEQYLRKMHERAWFKVIEEAPQKVKEHFKDRQFLRFAQSRGPGTITRILTAESRRLPDQWFAAKKSYDTGGDPDAIDKFLRASDNYLRLVLQHVLEDDRDYILLGKGKFAGVYKVIRAQRDGLTRSGEMPENFGDLVDWITDYHNAHKADDAEVATPGEVKQALIDEVSEYMRTIAQNTAENKVDLTDPNIDIISYENEFTQARGGKIAPGTLYKYGLTDHGDLMAKGNAAVQFYAVRYRDSLQLLHRALSDEHTKLRKELERGYSPGVRGRAKLDNQLLQRQQLTLWEVERFMNRVGGLLENSQRIVDRRRDYSGDDVADRMVNAWANLPVGLVLTSPVTWVRNAGGQIMWALKTAEVARGGWARATPTVVYNGIKTLFTTLIRSPLWKATHKGEIAEIKKLIEQDPRLVEWVAKQFSGMQQEYLDRQYLRQLGVTDSFSWKDSLGWDSEMPLVDNLKGAMAVLRNVRDFPDTTTGKWIASWMGTIPRAGLIATRYVGMRMVDNFLNLQASQVATDIANGLRQRSILAFDARLKTDPVFRSLYQQYGDNFKRFSIMLTSQGGLMREVVSTPTGHTEKVVDNPILTPAELTGKLFYADRAAVMLRRTFERNNDSVDLLMLRYWWNQRHEKGDRNAPFMKQWERNALMFALAEDANMATLASRATFFSGSKWRQMSGVLLQYWIWVTDRMAETVSKVRGQRTLGVRYLPHALAFLAATAAAGMMTQWSANQINENVFGQLAREPLPWEATDDEQFWRLLAVTSANYWGMMGSLVKNIYDSPGKIGYKDPIFYANVVRDLIGTASKAAQTGDWTNATLDFLVRYNPPARAIINRLPGREGLMDVRNASNALRAATPGSMEAVRRQPSSGSDFRGTAMTPLYNAILNAAVLGQWSDADEAFGRAVEQQAAQGTPNPEAAVLSAIRTRTPEAAVFRRALTPGEREQVYNRLTPENRQRVDQINDVFNQLATRYGRGGAALVIPRVELPRAVATPSATGGLTLGVPRGTRTGFRTASLRRRGGGRMPRSRRIRRSRLRLRRLAA